MHHRQRPARQPLHQGALTWEEAQDWDTFRAAFPTLHADHIPLRTFWLGLTHTPHREANAAALISALSHPPSREAFKAALHSHTRATSGGPTELTYRMMHHWPEATQDKVYDLLCVLWRSGHVPDWWTHKWLVPIPKKVANPTPSDLRPIVLLEVLRKTWTSLITGTIMNIIQSSVCLCPSQHAFLRRKGTDSATLQLVNMMEEAHATGQPLYGSSWDIRKAFDTISKPIIRLAWLRQGVPPHVVGARFQLMPSGAL